ncbi:hypothetical protein FA15DRAFT_678047 [Coprinopsis marcescibilis]|uniref:Atg29 N-terminal domain-containing protein n=1 Tax=Coprinopsis marcescibilis TaxID=230819 RepID=A0A5C3L8E3_COPMA|nr:hypothetical protein FA15DRAFT_678047 [Coprinopsis marcescibilis]
MPAQSLRVVVRLPTTRPENPPPDPPQIEWTPEKADILWKVIERSRSTDSGGADWKGLAAHLEVPLPYLLYRVNARFQEEIRGLKDIQDTLSPGAAQPPPSPYTDGVKFSDKPTALHRLQTRMTGSTRLSTSGRLNTPLGVRARLNSLTNNSPRPKKAISSSTITVQGPRRSNTLPIRPESPKSSSGSDTDSSEEHALKEEEAERAAEEQEVLNRKLEELQRMITNEAIGLVSNVRPHRRSLNLLSPRSPRSPGSSSRPDTLSTRSGSQSVSSAVSSASSPQGSIPDIPSPNGDSQPHSPIGRQFSRTTSPPTVSRRNAVGSHSHRSHPQSDGYTTSSYGSEASSFSDLSGMSLCVFFQLGV